MITWTVVLTDGCLKAVLFLGLDKLLFIGQWPSVYLFWFVMSCNM